MSTDRINSSFLARMACGALLISLAGCGSSPPRPDGKGEAVVSVDLVQEGIKVSSTGCKSADRTSSRGCKILEIESTGSAPIMARSVASQKAAMDAACAYALSNVRNWYGQRVDSSRTVQRTDSARETNRATRNLADSEGGVAGERTSQTDSSTYERITTTVRQSASGFMEGWSPSRQDIVDGQVASCTMRWNRSDVELMKQVRGQ